ncbi:DUF4397 domain-containing protein [Niastella caeni]|uniref:DUF4397 domain-containing protein n=1 Tax=Niastella caeni TaxID=2569763 RepID=A0A4S8HKA0_9BACT|nr:DUF4397 domain-containing protein [Niastella caeni]THU34759.1 DUF4397 domain-containing protein [Niastella caeni]
MKHIITILTILIIASCSKEQTFSGTASLTLINAVPNSTPSLVTNFSGTDPINYRNALKLEYGKADKGQLNLSYTGEQRLAIYKYPDTNAHNAPLYDLTLHLQVGATYTLFLTGTLTVPDTMFTIDNPPYHPISDSSLGIRFVNLMAGSVPVSVNLAGRAHGSEANNLSYKSMTGFTNYAATAGISKYTFEFRNTATGALISSLDVGDINKASFNARRYRNFTLALIGSPGDPTTHKAMLIETFTSLN